MQTIKIKDFNLAHTLESGQLFRYSSHENGWQINHRDDSFYVEQKEDKLFFDSISKDKLSEFLGLAQDFEAIKNELDKDKRIAQLRKQLHGLRIMKQDPWECLVGFICSSASNIPKIKMNLSLITENFGSSGKFPKPGELNNLELLKKCKTGFRAKYLYEMNKIVDEKFLKSLSKLNYEEAKLKLVDLPGVGEKIADCVLLFAYNKFEAFPVDTWIKKVMEELYLKKETHVKKISEFGRQKFGRYAGYAQQYLYHWGRNER